MSRIRALAVAMTVLLVGVLGATTASSAGAAPGAKGGKGGAEALAQLGAALPAVATEHGITEAQLRTRLDTDPTLRVDPGNKLFYVEPTAPAVAPAGVTALGPTFDTILPANAFTLHSKPGSNRVIYLDFDGATLSGTAWNSNTGGPCSTGAYDLDGNVGSFSDAERYLVISVWKRVSDDYAPFDVDVTTADPGYDAINRSSSGDTTFGTTALITNSTTTCPNGQTLYANACGGCGGVAYIGVYDSIGSSHDYYQPALVFQNGNLNDAKSVTEATSHEIGHNIGLYHDGTSSVGYYSGHGSWAPIMGVGYYRAISQWSKGEYSGANNTEDDFAVAGSNGMPLRADDHGDTAAAATALTVSGGTFSADGVISTRTDVDAFTFSAGSGPATISVAPNPVSPNLDIKLELRDAGGTLVASNDPASGSSTSDNATGMGASVTATLTAGTYTVLVDGVGYGDPLNTGYSDYGSVGNFRLTGTVSNIVGNAPVAVVTATPTSGTVPLPVTFTGSGSSDVEGAIAAYAWTFGDGGTDTTADPTHTYTTAGTYTAKLVVTDSDGNTSSATKTITVSNPVPKMDVASLVLAMAKTGTGKASGTATVTVRNGAGTAISGATVKATWTVNGKATNKSATTNTSGSVVFSSGSLKVSTGQTVKFCVTGLTKSGTTWDATLYSPGTTAADCASWIMP